MLWTHIILHREVTGTGGMYLNLNVNEMRLRSLSSKTAFIFRLLNYEIIRQNSFLHSTSCSCSSAI